MALNPNTDAPNSASRKPTNSFHERYASDAEFKRQVDEGRRRMQAERTATDVSDALRTVRSRDPKDKMY